MVSVQAWKCLILQQGTEQRDRTSGLKRAWLRYRLSGVSVSSVCINAVLNLLWSVKLTLCRFKHLHRSASVKRWRPEAVGTLGAWSDTQMKLFSTVWNHPQNAAEARGFPHQRLLISRSVTPPALTHNSGPSHRTVFEHLCVFERGFGGILSSRCQCVSDYPAQWAEDRPQQDQHSVRPHTQTHTEPHTLTCLQWLWN